MDRNDNIITTRGNDRYMIVSPKYPCKMTWYINGIINDTIFFHRLSNAQGWPLHSKDPQGRTTPKPLPGGPGK